MCHFYRLKLFGWHVCKRVAYSDVSFLEEMGDLLDAWISKTQLVSEAHLSTCRSSFPCKISLGVGARSYPHGVKDRVSGLSQPTFPIQQEFVYISCCKASALGVAEVCLAVSEAECQTVPWHTAICGRTLDSTIFSLFFFGISTLDSTLRQQMLFFSHTVFRSY